MDREAFPAATHLDVEAEVRYWEDAYVGGVQDLEGTLIPGRDGDVWKIRLELATGRIEGWPEGVEAQVHYKVCDQGLYWLSDAAGVRIARWGGFYVPDEFLCHGDQGYGDYVIFQVLGDGIIADYRRPWIEEGRWKPLASPAA